MSTEIVWKSPKELRPHPLNKVIYGPPTANSAYFEIKADMQKNGFDPNYPLLISHDGRVLWGNTRWAVAANALAIDKVPCRYFEPSNPDDAELEMEREVVRDNMKRRERTERMKANEQRKLLEVETHLARRRMGSGSDGEASESMDRVGKQYNQSGQTVRRRIKVLEAVEGAEAAGDRKTADRLIELLEAKSIVKALDFIQGKKTGKAKKPPKVEVPRTFNDHAVTAYSEFFEACAKATVPAEMEILTATLGRMKDDLDAARAKLERKTRPSS
jgi:hypothetical protein